MTLLASVKNVNFALSEENKVMPSVESFLGQLSMAEHAFESGHPDFTVIQLPPAILHPLTVDRLCKSVVHFLEKYNAIQVDASSVQNHNVLQTRRLLTMIVSPHHGIAAVPMTQAHQQSSFAGQDRKLTQSREISPSYPFATLEQQELDIYARSLPVFLKIEAPRSSHVITTPPVSHLLKERHK